MTSAPTHPDAANPTPAPEVRTVAFVSLGCPKNLVDSEKMLGLLAEDGLLPVSETAGDEADAIVINTCGFLEASKQESLEVIHDALRRKESGEIKRVVVAGCLVQRHRAKLLEWAPGIDAMVGVFDRDKIVEAVRGEAAPREALESKEAPKYWIAANALQAARERRMPTVGLTVQGKDGKGLGYFESDASRLRLTPRHFAYLRVSEGCNQNCAFCTIPSIRGKMRSKPLDAIVREARELVRDGAFELNLIGQDTTSYGDDIGAGFRPGAAAKDFDAMGGLPALLAAVSRVIDEEAGRGNGWVRLMYAYPTNFTDEMIDAVATIPNLARYIDIPLQHASDHMLEKMRRRVTAKHQRDLIGRLRQRSPDFAVRTTFITGFPGETEADHRALLEFVESMRFEMMGVFEYSREEGTVAGTMDEDPNLFVPLEVKARRREELMLLQQRIAFEKAEALAAKFDETVPESGARFDILIDAPIAEAGRESKASRRVKSFHTYQGRTYFQAPQIDSVTTVRSRKPLSVGELVRCVIVESDGYDLIAAPVEDLDRRVSLSVVS